MQIVHHQAVDTDSPRAISVRPVQNKMNVCVSAPLRYEKAPQLFELTWEDQVFCPAEADIGETCICVFAADVSCPVHVRYAWFHYGQANVFGVNGFPLAPFFLR